jgi:sugar phosphate permease
VARYRWTILALGTAAQASYSAVFLGLPVLAPALDAEFDLSLAEIGLVLASANLGSVATLLGWGFLADRIGERAVIAVGLAVAAAVLTAAGFASSFALLVVLLTIAGAAGASVNAASGRAVMSWFDRSQRGFALGIRQTAVPLGGMAAALALPPIAEAWGVRGGLLAMAAACALTSAAAAVGLREAPAELERGDVTEPLRDPRIWRLAAGSALVLGAQSAILGFSVLFLHSERGLSIGEAAAVLALMQLAGAGLRVGSGVWSDRVGARVAPLRRLAVALAVALAAGTALLDAPLAFLLPTLVVAGALSLSWNGLSFTATAELAGRARSGAALGFQQTALSVCGSVVPPAFAALVAATSWRAGFAVAALLPLAGANVLRRLSI